MPTSITLDPQAQRCPVPRLVERQLAREDAMGICDTCAGALDTAEPAKRQVCDDPTAWQTRDALLITAGFLLFVIFLAHAATVIADAIPN